MRHTWQHKWTVGALLVLTAACGSSAPSEQATEPSGTGASIADVSGRDDRDAEAHEGRDTTSGRTTTDTFLTDDDETNSASAPNTSDPSENTESDANQGPDDTSPDTTANDEDSGGSTPTEGDHSTTTVASGGPTTGTTTTAPQSDDDTTTTTTTTSTTTTSTTTTSTTSTTSTTTTSTTTTSTTTAVAEDDTFVPIDADDQFSYFSGGSRYPAAATCPQDEGVVSAITRHDGSWLWWGESFAVVGFDVNPCFFLDDVVVREDGSFEGEPIAARLIAPSGEYRAFSPGIARCWGTPSEGSVCFNLGWFVPGAGDVGTWTVIIDRADGYPTAAGQFEVRDRGRTAVSACRDQSCTDGALLLSGYPPGSRPTVHAVVYVNRRGESYTFDVVGSLELEGPLIGSDGTAIFDPPPLPNVADWLTVQGIPSVGSGTCFMTSLGQTPGSTASVSADSFDCTFS